MSVALSVRVSSAERVFALGDVSRYVLNAKAAAGKQHCVKAECEWAEMLDDGSKFKCYPRRQFIGYLGLAGCKSMCLESKLCDKIWGNLGTGQAGECYLCERGVRDLLKLCTMSLA